MLKNILKKLIKKKHADLPNLSLIENFKIEKPYKPIKNILFATSSGGIWGTPLRKSGHTMAWVELITIENYLTQYLQRTENETTRFT